MGIATDGFEVPPLVADAAPLAVGRYEPPFRLRAHRLGEANERFRVACVGGTHDKTHGAPPRRGSPAAARVPSGSTSTAFAPPKNRLRSRQRMPPSISMPGSTWVIPAS